ncbi:MAG: GNAT family N-acetyltransferase [Bacteroidota bacterium]|nr:GNAT family N-acetyltransferase [Bacteroidota bacterium]
MAFDIHFPQELRGTQLDAYLAQGWYRIGQAVFTTDTIDAHQRGEPGEEVREFRVFWLRYRLTDFQFGKKQLKLLAANRKFKADIGECVLDPGLEALYASYKSSIDFTIAPSLYQSLYKLEFYEAPDLQVYDSRLISVSYEGKLIAAGVFDRGARSLAGIVNFFDPGFRKYSPGKYLMLLKIQYALQQGMEYYYPGYISCDFKKFDYKLWPGESFAEILNPLTQKWEPYSPALMDLLKKEVVW